MNYVLLAPLALLLTVACVAFWYFVRPSSRSADTPAQDRVDTVIGWQPSVTRVMTPAEQKTYETLQAALPDYIVLSQVPLSRFIKVTTRLSYAEWLRRVGDQCADLVVCDRASKVLAAVEVQSASAQTNPRAIKRSARKARSLKAAGVAFHIWPETALPSVSQVRQLLWSSSTATIDLQAAPLGAVQSSAATKVTPGLEALSQQALMADDGIEFNDAPPSTWFDDLDSSPMPMTPNDVTQKTSPVR